MLGVTKTAAGVGNVALTERPEPAVRPGHVVLEVVGAGICGTDLHIWDDEFPSEPPVTMGHEVSGVVRERRGGRRGLGRRATEWSARRTSRRAASASGARRAGRTCASERRSIGSREDGAFAPLVLVPARGLHRIPDWLDGHAASLAEPLACVCNCLLDPQLVRGRRPRAGRRSRPGRPARRAGRARERRRRPRARHAARRGAPGEGPRARLRDVARRWSDDSRHLQGSAS